MSGTLAPPYAILDGKDGMFDIARQLPPADQPTEAEEALFSRAQLLLGEVRERLARKATLPDDFLKRLRAAVDCGLCGTIRHAPVASYALQRLERTLLRGPFTVGNAPISEGVALTRNNAVALTDEQRAFVTELEQAERIILSLYRDGGDDDRRRIALLNLRNAAVIALMDVPGDVKLGRMSVQGAVQGALREAGQGARVRYLGGLAGSYAFTCFRFILAILAFWGLQHVWPAHLHFPDMLRVPGQEMMLLGVAVAMFFCGAWLSAATRLQPNSAEVLDAIFTETFSAPLRALYLLGFALLALLLLHKEVVVFSFGKEGEALFTSAEVLKTLSASILTGAFLGLGEAALPGAVSERSKGLVAALGGTPAAR